MRGPPSPAAGRPGDDRPPMTETILDRCEAAGLRMTGQRRTVARVLEASSDHPDVEELHRRAAAEDARISLATVYRTVKLFEDAGIVEKVDFGDGRAVEVGVLLEELLAQTAGLIDTNARTTVR